MPPKRARSHPAALLAVGLVLALLGASCSSSRAQGSIASHLIFGAPPECPTRITCLAGLEKIYGLHFKRVEALDELGPVSVAALADNRVQVVRLDSSDPNISGHRWVILQDDKSFQPAGNIIPEIRTATATGEVTTLLDNVSDSMTEADLFALDAAVQVEQQTPQVAAENYVRRRGLAATSKVATTETITVGSANFSENETLAYVYIDVLESAGYVVKSKVGIGSREQYQPELANGEIDIVPEYVGSILSSLDPTVGKVSLSASVTMVRTLLSATGLTVLDPSSAADADAIVVTQATAGRFHLTKISDLASPYSG